MGENIGNPQKKNPQKSPSIFFCESCNYTTSNKKDYNRHLSTRKHKILQNPTKSYKKTPKNPHSSFHVNVEKFTNILPHCILIVKNAKYI